MRLPLPLFALAACAATHGPDASPAPHAAISTVEAFRTARTTGDAAAMAALLADDPRIWYGSREGEGSPWHPAQPSAGRWSAWDEHFRGHSERAGEWTVTDRAVSAVMFETNDYYALTGRGGSRWRATWFLDDDGRIEGFMVSSASSPGSSSDADVEQPEDRRAEFEAWARAHHPDEAEYLMPGGSIDPTADRPARMRALLNAWRAEVGLEPIH